MNFQRTDAISFTSKIYKIFDMNWRHYLHGCMTIVTSVPKPNYDQGMYWIWKVWKSIYSLNDLDFDTTDLKPHPIEDVPEWYRQNKYISDVSQFHKVAMAIIRICMLVRERMDGRQIVERITIRKTNKSATYIGSFSIFKKKIEGT
jgi:hypothetical protein